MTNEREQDSRPKMVFRKRGKSRLRGSDFPMAVRVVSTMAKVYITAGHRLPAEHVDRDIFSHRRGEKM
jgi:hypothetical protein